MIDDRNPYDFEANKTYEETFVENNANLIKELTGTSEVVSLSQTKLDVFAGIDLLVQQGRSIVGIALRIRKPTAYKWRYNFTLGHHISKPNSQIHTIMNSLHSTEVLYPNYILQINGIEDNGYCADCVAIKIQTNLSDYLTVGWVLWNGFSLKLRALYIIYNLTFFYVRYINQVPKIKNHLS